MIITISGNPGSGKSTVAKILVEKLKAERVYVGGIRRELAREKGMDLNELNEYAKNNPETDVDVDKRAAAKARDLEKNNSLVVVEGRTQFHFLPESIKVYVVVDFDVGAERIWKEIQNKDASQARNEGTINSIEKLKATVRKRDEDDAQRYLKYYGFDHRKLDNYDLIVNSSEITAEEVAQKIIGYLEKIK